jgi:hypothetical protein
MIYKSNLDGQWYKINPDYVRFNVELNHIRRELFKSGVFRIDKDKDLDQYHLYVRDWPIGVWSPGNTERARMFIDSAFSTYYALTRCK